MIETDIISSIAVNTIGRAVILVIMYVKTFRTNFIVFICHFVITTSVM